MKWPMPQNQARSAAIRAVGASSHSQTRTTRPTTANGSQNSGGMASAASAPAINPAPSARHP